jgi:hypothetical protein
MRTVGEPFPAFRLQAVVGTPPQFQEIDEHTYPGKWKVIFFWRRNAARARSAADQRPHAVQLAAGRAHLARGVSRRARKED